MLEYNNIRAFGKFIYRRMFLSFSPNLSHNNLTTSLSKMNQRHQLFEIYFISDSHTTFFQHKWNMNLVVILNYDALCAEFTYFIFYVNLLVWKYTIKIKFDY